MYGGRQSMEREGASAEVNGTRLYYEVTGAGQPLVLIHGFTLDRRMWDDQIAPFAARYRVIAYDARGFGRSALPSGEPFAHSDDLKALLEHLDAAPAHVAGLSMGGEIAVDFALTYSDLVRTLIPVDAVISGYEWYPASIQRLRAVSVCAKEKGIAAAKALWLTDPLFADAAAQPALAERLSEILDGYSGCHWLKGDGHRAPEPPAIASLANSDANAGHCRDREVPECLEIVDLLARHIPDVQTVMIPRAGHIQHGSSQRRSTRRCSSP